MSLFERFDSRPVPPSGITEPLYTPGRALSRRRALGKLLMAGGFTSMLVGGVGGLYVNVVEGRQINILADRVSPAPVGDDLRQAQADKERVTREAQEAAGRAVASGKTITLAPPAHLPQALEVIASQDRHDAEWQRLATERGFWTKGVAGLQWALLGGVATIIGLVIRDDAVSKIYRERSEFQRTNLGAVSSAP